MSNAENETPLATEAKEPSVEDRLSALEQALASLGDAVSPGGSRASARYAEWRKGIDSLV